MIYWDTSATLKLYVVELDSVAWREFGASISEAFISCSLLNAEMAVTLMNKEKRGEIRPGWAAKLQTDFRRDVEAGVFQIAPIGSDIVERAISVAERCMMSKKTAFLRTLDALHLSAALHLRCSSMATSDERMKQAAKILGLPVVTP